MAIRNPTLSASLDGLDDWFGHSDGFPRQFWAAPEAKGGAGVDRRVEGVRHVASPFHVVMRGSREALPGQSGQQWGACREMPMTIMGR